MNCLIAIIACALAMLYLPAAQGAIYYPMDPYFNPYTRGGSYFDEDHARGRDSARGGGFLREGSDHFYDEGDGFHRSRKVIEDEGGSRHRVGGGSSGLATGDSFERSDMYGRDHSSGGRRFSGFGR